MAKYLISKGHECRVLLHQAKTYGITDHYDFEGVQVFIPTRGIEEHLFAWCTHAMSHLEYTSYTIEMCKIYKRPCFFIVHNDIPYDCVNFTRKPMNVIYNSQWIADKLQYPHRSMVLHPPVDYRKYDVNYCPEIRTIEDTHKAITLINCNENKGGKIFQQIVDAMPKYEFLAVKGSYDEQFVPSAQNITVLENSPHILPTYLHTRVLLMPSKYESFGMTCTEAMCNGIPVICTRTPGLLENASYAGIFIDDRDDIDAWVKAIKSLDKPKNYEKYSKLSRQRSRELDPTAEYEVLEQFIYEAV